MNGRTSRYYCFATQSRIFDNNFELVKNFLNSIRHVKHWAFCNCKLDNSLDYFLCVCSLDIPLKFTTFYNSIINLNPKYKIYLEQYGFKNSKNYFAYNANKNNLWFSDKRFEDKYFHKVKSKRTIKKHKTRKNINSNIIKSIDFEATRLAYKLNPSEFIDVDNLDFNTQKRAIFKCLKNPEHNNRAITIGQAIRTICPQCANNCKPDKDNNLLKLYQAIAESIDFKQTIEANKKDNKHYSSVTCLADCAYTSPYSNKRAIFKCLKNPEHNNWDATINSRTSLGRGCPQCANNRVSKEEKSFKNELVKILQLKSNEYKTNVRIIPSFNKNSKQKLELDFVCEKLGIAVEFNGAYWHSDKVIRKTKGVSANFYHRYKFEQAKKLGLTLLFVREQDWMDNKEAVLTAIQNYCFKHTEIPKILQF